MKKLTWFITLFALCDLVQPDRAHTNSILLEFSPESQVVQMGQQVFSGISITRFGDGMLPSIGAFDLDVSFDSLLLSPTAVTFGPFLGEPGIHALTSFRFFAGVVNIAEVSLLPPGDLDVLQPVSFGLATLQFTALASGTASFGFSRALVLDGFGNHLPQIPQPSTVLLVAAGLSVLVARARPRGGDRLARSRARFREVLVMTLYKPSLSSRPDRL
jgi:hypothetical protein